MEKMMAIEEKVSVIPSVSLLLSSESIIICRFICRHLSVHCHYQNRQLDRSNSQSHFDNDEDDVFFFCGQSHFDNDEDDVFFFVVWFLWYSKYPTRRKQDLNRHRT